MANVNSKIVDMKLLKAIGYKIARLRVDAGYSHEKFSEITNITERTIGAIENGRLTNIIYIKRICDALNVKIDYLFEED